MEMAQGFYQLDNTALKFDVIKDIEKIQLNHILMQKENFTRIKGDLPKGYFNTSIHEVSEKLNVTRNKATRLLKEFVELNIITMVKRGTSKNSLSVYKYNAVTTTEEISIEVEPKQATDVVNENIATDNVNPPDHFEYDFYECGIMKKLDMCEQIGIILNCDKNDIAAMNTLKGMDEYILKTCLDVAYLNKKTDLSYILGTYHRKGGVVDIERERIFYQLAVEEQRRKIEERRKQDELKAQQEEAKAQAEAQAQLDLMNATTVETQDMNYPIDEKTGLPVYPNTSPNFSFTRDCIGYTTYIDLLEGKENILDTNVNLARHYAKYYQVDTAIIDQAQAEGRVVSRG